MTRHYLDHASTSPTRPEAIAAMTEALAVPAGGDPARIHHEGQSARVAVEEAREQVARFFGARSREVVFTSGATEAISAATFGATERGRHIVASAVEHSAVRLSAERHELTLVGCDRLGRIDRDELMSAVRPETALVHVQWGNHEVATVQRVAEVIEACRERGVLVHVDAAQANGHVGIDFRSLGADLMSVSAHKMGGPPGIGALLIRRGLRLRALLVGGDQERARRAGLENVPAIVGWGAAAAGLTAERLEKEAGIARSRTDRILAEASRLDGVRVYGDPDLRLPHLVCLGVDGIEPQAVLLALDQAGIAVHSGSACASEDLLPSPVLEAMGVDAHHSLRISVGWSTTDEDVDALLSALPEVLTRLRALGRS
jgi:cysteine desulfurase